MMKKLRELITISFIILMAVGTPVDAQDMPIKIMSYNLKFASPTFEPAWDVRREWQVDLIRKYDPDIIGKQEGLLRCSTLPLIRA